jgi:plasmid maintenance system antidote protein VapI
MTDKQPITDSLRNAINSSELSFLALEKATGVIRQSLMTFARGESGISIEAADKLAVYFGLELQPARKRKGK